jgi:hypothetical protein
MTYMRSWKSHRLTSHTWFGLYQQIGRPLSRIVGATGFFFIDLVEFCCSIIWTQWCGDKATNHGVEGCWFVLDAVVRLNRNVFRSGRIRKPIGLRSMLNGQLGNATVKAEDLPESMDSTKKLAIGEVILS